MSNNKEQAPMSANEYLKQNGCIKNSYGNYIYASCERGVHQVNLPVILKEYADQQTAEKDKEILILKTMTLLDKVTQDSECFMKYLDLKQKADNLSDALKVYLMAGHKDARREASIQAKNALDNYHSGKTGEETIKK